MLIAAIIAAIWAVIVLLGLQNWAKKQLEELLTKFDTDIASATVDYSKNRNYAHKEVNTFFGSNTSVIVNQKRLNEAILSKAKSPLTADEVNWLMNYVKKLLAM